MPRTQRTPKSRLSVTGVEVLGALGTVSAIGAATAAASGVDSLATTGTVTASGAATITVSGVSASGSIGAVGIGTSATIGVTGVQAIGAVGTVTAIVTGQQPPGPVLVVGSGGWRQPPPSRVHATACVTGVEAIGWVGYVRACGIDPLCPWLEDDDLLSDELIVVLFTVGAL